MNHLCPAVHQNPTDDTQLDQLITITNDYNNNVQIILLGDVLTNGRWCKLISYITSPLTLKTGQTISFSFPAPRKNIVRTLNIQDTQKKVACNLPIPTSGAITHSVQYDCQWR